LNVAVGLGRLGVDVALLARLAQDRFGRQLRDHLRGLPGEPGADQRVGRPDHGWPCSTSTRAAWRRTTSTSTAAPTADGARIKLPAELFAGAALHVSGSLALPVPTMGSALEVLLTRERPRRVIAFDPNIRPSLVRDEAAVRARLERWLGLPTS